MHCWLVSALVLSALTVVNTAEILDPYWRNVGIEIFSAIKFYSTNYAFKLLDASADETPVDVGIARKVYFTIKETVCFNPPEKPIAACAFKDGGAVKNCTIYIPAERSGRIRIGCDPRHPVMRPVTSKTPQANPSDGSRVTYFLCCSLGLCSCRRNK